MFGDVPASVLERFHAHAGLPRQGAWFIHQVEVTGDYLISSADEILKDHLSNIHEEHVRQALALRSKETTLPVLKDLAGQYVLLGGPGMRIYGHWLIEMLPKLHILEALQMDLGSLNFLLPSDLPRFAVLWLELLGIAERQLLLYDPRREILRIEELVIPSILHNGVRVGTEFAQAATTLGRFVQQKSGVLKPSAHGHKIFLSRRNTGLNRQLINRDHIEQIAQEHGFSIVCPETLALVEQISLFKNAQFIIGEYGSALHGSMFSGPGTVVCGLRGSRLHPGFIQSGIGRVLQQPTGYVFGKSLPDDPAGSFVVQESDFRSCLKLAFAGLQFERLHLDLG
jgi:capsular polysaccharide biosynthesis protein